jgi:hypothetical protein
VASPQSIIGAGYNNFIGGGSVNTNYGYNSAIIGGDFNYGFGNKTRKARKIKNFQQDIKINEGLWELANDYVN